MNYSLLIGDCVEQMRGLDDQSVNCCVTSPPYFGLRDYGMAGQIGLEDTPDAYVAKMVEVFREVKRVLRDDGTLWLNLGDSYAASTRNLGRNDAGRDFTGGGGNKEGSGNPGRQGSIRAEMGALKPKDLIGIPWRVAFALQADGWYLRQDIIWHKPNPMPESVTDRCTKAHEYLFLLSKSPRYFWDAEAMKEPVSPKTNPRASKSRMAQVRAAREAGANSSAGIGRSGGKVHAVDGMVKSNASFENALALPVSERNRRSVWTVTTKPYAGAHFATFPPDLIEPCILAGCPRGGIVLDPFGGSGTTAGVAVRNGRRAILCELSPEYAALVDARVLQIAGDQIDMFREAAE